MVVAVRAKRAQVIAKVEGERPVVHDGGRCLMTNCS
jgi:hypothetical protein